MAAAASSSGPRERIQFEINIPQQVTIDSEPTEQQSRDGSPEWRYFLQDRKIMWVPAQVEQQIRELGAGIGDTLQILKCRQGRNNVWHVTPVADETPAEEAVRATATAPAARPASRPAPTPAPQRRQEPTPGAMTQPAQQTLPGTPSAAFSSSLYSCMCAAIRVAAAAEQFAREVQRPVAFETQDIRAMATTLFIHATGGR